MGKIAKRESQLPAKPEELRKWILIGKVNLAAQIKAIKAIDKLEEGVVAKEAALLDTQDLAEGLLYAESRLGEMLEDVADPTASRAGRRQLPEGVSHKDSHYTQELSKKKNIVEKAKGQQWARTDISQKSVESMDTQ